MELDARRLPAGTRFEADLCIIGAGPTGLTLARACLDRGIRVLLLESGGVGAEIRPQELNEGRVIGSPYAGLRVTRHRQVGGGAGIWNTPLQDRAGAKYVPLDPWDLEARWPLPFTELEPYYRKAQGVCGLGRYSYHGADWALPEDRLWPLPDDRIVTRVYQFGPAGLFTDRYPEDVRAAPDAQVCHHATVSRLVPDALGRRVTEAHVETARGNRLSAHARVFVLASGAVENARLLLISRAQASIPTWLGSEWVGRGFMEHPRDSTLTLYPGSSDLYRDAGFYDPHIAGDGTVIAGRFGLHPDVVRGKERLPNASVTVLPRVRADANRRSWRSRLLARLSGKGRDRSPGRPGWSRNPEAEGRFEGLRLYTNLEQLAHPENRIVLGDDRDALGLPRPVLHWQWREEDQARLERLRRFLADAFEGAGLGRVAVEAGVLPDPNAHHHAGTTRMSAGPDDGVVDPDGLVHRTENLYAAGGSVFPSAGFANPTLTCVALALRLADHLAVRLRADPASGHRHEVSRPQ
jgi:choline dehydrogenase-like flavoprotein